MDHIDIEEQANKLVHSVKHNLISMMGVTLETAQPEEFFRALSLSLRDQVMINWTATMQTMQNEAPRTLYYICMEYMPGRLLINNIINTQAMDMVKLAMKKMNRDLSLIAQMEREPALGNGGLGRLASCILDALATQQYPAIGYGLRYQYGIFKQEVVNGIQVERPENWLLDEYPWEFRRDTHTVKIKYGGKRVDKKNSKGEEVYDVVDHEEVLARAYDIPIVGYRDTPDFSVLSLRLWTTKESPRNFQLQRYNAGLYDQASENTALTDVLYPNDNHEMGKRIRLKQEYLLAVASIRNIFENFMKSAKSIDLFADRVRIHINDTHPALAVADLMHMLTFQYNFGWNEAFEVVKTCCNYTNHSILREALEEWNELRVAELLPRHYRIIQRLNQQLCNTVRAKYPGDEERVQRVSMFSGGQIRMSHLAIYGSHKVNGVAALHTKILETEIFKDLYELYPEKFINVTNGVTQRRWINLCNPLLAEFISKRVGRGWITDFSEIEKLAPFASDPESQKEFLQIKRANKVRFIEMQADQSFQFLSPDALFDVQIKRVHEYKRQLMNALHAIMLFQELLDNPHARKIQRMVIIGGKAFPGYEVALNVIELIFCVGRKILSTPQVKDRLRVFYYENYNASHAELIIPAADLSEQISCAGMEASGTGNMKLSMNGALTIATEDGASIEMHQAITDQWWPFRFGQTAEQNENMRGYNPQAIYEQNPKIKRALDALKDRTFAQNDEEHESFRLLYNSLLDPAPGIQADPFFVLNDLQSFYDTQKKVEELYLNPSLWAQYAIQNMSHMFRFSVDQTVHNYAQLAWGLLPCPVDPKQLTTIRKQYEDNGW